MSAALRRGGPLPASRLAVFAALSLFAALHWSALLSEPPLLRVLAATLALIAAAAGMAAIGVLARPRRWKWAAAALALLLGLVFASLALGVPARLLAPSGWGELSANLRVGLDVIGDAGYPYMGGGEWSRLAILLGLAALVGVAAALAFWPSRAAAGARALVALIVLVAAYGIAATLAPPSAPLLEGLLLFVLVAAWLWLPGLDRRDGAAGLALLAVAGVVALPLSARIGGDEPLLDYTAWDFSGAAPDDTEFFSWNHSYGPIGWPRTGRRLLSVRSADPHYWRTAVLDRFDGFRWLEPQSNPARALELPSEVEGKAAPATLEPAWVHTARFGIDALSSQLIVGSGAPLSVQGLGATIPAAGGIVPSDGEGISSGEHYSVRAYSPEPSAARLRRAGERRYQPALRRYTEIALPERDAGTLPAQPGRPAEVEAIVSPLTVPLRQPAGRVAGNGGAGRRLLASPYSGVYRLALDLTRGAPTGYDAVEAIRNHLRSTYSYSESPPLRRYPLRAFLFRDGVGYCQQFSGTMALMLRMIGVPSRVASGFSPGTRVGNNFVVSDFDAHSWVEVYFEGIGWVAFDPTPSAAPAASISPGPAAAPALPRGRELPEIGAGRPGAGAVAAPAGGGGLPAWVVAGAAASLLAALAALAVALRRRRSLRGEALADAQLAELRRALPRLGRPISGGATLRRLERDSAELGRRDLASYLAKLRRFRYEDSGEPPDATDRRRLRRELGRRGGPLQALRALRALPPLGPRPAPPSSGA